MFFFEIQPYKNVTTCFRFRRALP